MSYVTGATIKKLRGLAGYTQRELAELIGVSDKAVSKWETGKGLPDAGIMEELAKALNVSLTELFTGDLRENGNTSGNMKRVKFYVCPACGNVIAALGEGSYSCCGIHLMEAEPEQEDDAHMMQVELIEDEYYVTMNHPMEKGHYISYIAYVTSQAMELIKLYPEQNCSVRFRKKGHGYLYGYCNRHGLYKVLV